MIIERGVFFMVVQKEIKKMENNQNRNEEIISINRLKHINIAHYWHAFDTKRVCFPR